MNERADIVVSQGVFKARVVEMGIHEAGPWYLQWSGETRLAEREVDGSGVTFRALFSVPEILDSVVTLKLGDRVMAVRVMPALLDVAGRHPVEISWRLGLRVESDTEVET